MGMGYSSYEFEVINEEALAKACPQTFAVFNDLRTIINNSEAHSYDEYVQCSMDDENPEDMETLIDGVLPLEFYKKLKLAFKNLRDDLEKTVGIGISLGFHDSEASGSRYDDVDGAYFEATNVFGLTPAGVKAKELGLCESAQFVNFG